MRLTILKISRNDSQNSHCGSVCRARQSWSRRRGFDPCLKYAAHWLSWCQYNVTEWNKIYGLAALSRVWQPVKFSDLSIEPRPRDNLVADKNIKKPKKQSILVSTCLLSVSIFSSFIRPDQLIYSLPFNSSCLSFRTEPRAMTSLSFFSHWKIILVAKKKKCGCASPVVSFKIVMSLYAIKVNIS